MNKDKITTLAQFHEPEAYAVKWEFDGDTHRITYGIQNRCYLDSLTACREYGECIRHSLECSGAFNMENFE